MDFSLSAKAEDTCARMWDFMVEEVFPAERVYGEWREANDPHGHPPVLEELKASARKRACGICSFHMCRELSNLEYAPIAEISGWSPVIAPRGDQLPGARHRNMETLHLFGTEEQKRRGLEPLLQGEVRVRVRDDRARGGLLRRHQHHPANSP